MDVASYIQASRKLGPFFKEFILGEAASSRPPALSQLLFVGLGTTARLMFNSLQLTEVKQRTRILGSDPWADTDFSSRFARSCLPPSVGGTFSCRQILGMSLKSRLPTAVTCASAVQGGDEQHMHMYLPVRAGIESGAILRCYRNLAQRVRVAALPPLQLALPGLGERGKSRIRELPSCLKDFEGVSPAEIERSRICGSPSRRRDSGGSSRSTSPATSHFSGGFGRRANMLCV